ncbi:MAG TPA: YfhO family protein, partial [Candidatus Polarisedimenticolia bacterium]|nr:YfhO family protein [Candidatus Polarisedimenticolia bacterium]
WAAVEVALFSLGLLLLRRGGARGAATSWGLPAAAAISLLVAAAPARTMAPRASLTTPSPIRDLVDRGQGATRLHHSPRPPGLAVRGETDEQIWGYRFDRFTYALQTGHPDEVPTVFDAATDRMDLAAGAALAARLPALPAADQVRILRVASAGTVLAYAPLDDPGLVPGPTLAGASRPEARLYRVADPLPRVRFVSRQRPPRDPGDAAGSLLDPRFEPDSEVLLEGAVRSDPPGPPDRAEIEVLQDDPERVTIRLVAPRAGHLVVADSDAPGWVARVDGAPAPILRANMLFRAVPVPAGRHTIEMRYRPRSVFAGALASFAGAITLGTLCARRRRR